MKSLLIALSLFTVIIIILSIWLNDLLLLVFIPVFVVLAWIFAICIALYLQHKDIEDNATSSYVSKNVPDPMYHFED